MSTSIADTQEHVSFYTKLVSGRPSLDRMRRCPAPWTCEGMMHRAPPHPRLPCRRTRNGESREGRTELARAKRRSLVVGSRALRSLLRGDREGPPQEDVVCIVRVVADQVVSGGFERDPGAILRDGGIGAERLISPRLAPLVVDVDADGRLLDSVVDEVVELAVGISLHDVVRLRNEQDVSAVGTDVAGRAMSVAHPPSVGATHQ